MNILFYSHYFVPEIGAPSARLYDLSREWISSGHSVQVVTCFPNHPFGHLYPGYRRAMYMQENLEGIQVHRHWTFVTPNTGVMKKTLGHVSYLPSAILLSQPRLKPFDVAVATSPTFFPALAGIWAGRRGQIPFVMEVRDLWPAIFIELGIIKNRRLIQWLEKLEMYLYRKATRIVTVTEAFKQSLVDRRVPGTKIVAIPNGADIDFWKPIEDPADLRRTLGLEDCFVVLYVGTHGISHALERVLESAKALIGHPQIRFLFVGEGAEKEKLVHQAKEWNLNNVIFLDPVDKEAVKKFYALGDVCLVPLRDVPLFKTFIPSKMFEVMAMGRPILASLKGEAADILRRSKGALVVEPEDSGAMTESILHLSRHRKEGKAMGKEGRRFVVDHYSRRSLAMRYIDLLKEAVEGYTKVQ